MRKSVLDRLKVFGFVDTRNFRYVLDESGRFPVVRRLPLECLDRTSALDSWEIVSVDLCDFL